MIMTDIEDLFLHIVPQNEFNENMHITNKVHMH